MDTEYDTDDTCDYCSMAAHDMNDCPIYWELQRDMARGDS